MLTFLHSCITIELSVISVDLPHPDCRRTSHSVGDLLLSQFPCSQAISDCIYPWNSPEFFLKHTVPCSSIAILGLSRCFLKPSPSLDIWIPLTCSQSCFSFSVLQATSVASPGPPSWAVKLCFKLALPIHIRRKARFIATHRIGTLITSVFVYEKRCLKARAVPARSAAYPLLLLSTAECYWKRATSHT